jgi:hypothetical protein
VTYKLADEVVLPFPEARAPLMLPAAYYNVTVTFYAARNSDTASAGASASVLAAVAARIWTNNYYCPPGWLVYATSRSKPVPFVPYDWKRLWRTRDLCESLKTPRG